MHENANMPETFLFSIDWAKTICYNTKCIINGELSEWSKVQHSKCCVPKRDPGFESLTLRHKSIKLFYSLMLFCFIEIFIEKDVKHQLCF